ncbi:MAG: replication factor C large subunit [Candidatus Nanopusillus sp.]
MVEPWIKKYSPKHINEIINQAEAVGKIKSFIEKYPNVDKKALLLYGPPGVGKTSSIYAIANDLNYEVVEINASDNRNARAIHAKLGEAIKGKPFFRKGRIILVDEVDGLAGFQDRGGVGALIKIIEESRWPIILTANDPWDPKFKKLRDVCDMIEFKKLSNTDIIRQLRRICANEKITIDDDVLSALAERSSGDLRSSINDLQALATMSKHITLKDLEVLGYREREITIFRALGQMFKATTIMGATLPFADVDMDPEEIKAWVEENISNEYENIKEIYEAYNWLSLAVIFYGRIYKRQYWDLLKYFTTLMYAGVSLAKEKKYNKFTKYRMPQYVKRLAQNKEIREKIDELSKNLQKKVHTSRKRVREVYINILIVLMKNNEKMGKKYAEILGFNENEISYIKAAVEKL